MRTRWAVVAIVLALAGVSPAVAIIGTADNVPGTTLLFPYFEVDTAHGPQGRTTLIGIQNASATAVLGHVTLWTDLGVPTFVFDVYLTGYDTQTINLYDILVRGLLPQTASDGQDPSDTISPQGPISQDINFASCNGGGGTLPPAPLAADVLAHIQAWHRGATSPTTGTCAGSPINDGIARGYVTVDTVNACSSYFPSTAYFQSTISWQNVLLGDWYIVDSPNNFADADRAIAIESGFDPLGGYPSPCVVGGLTFYGRLTSWDGADCREPLPTIWMARYMSDASGLQVWRDPGVVVAPFVCGMTPAGFPLPAVQTLAFDTAENPLDLGAALFPDAAQGLDVEAGGIPATAKQGALFLNLNSTTSIAAPGPGYLRQSWVIVRQRHQGRFSASWPAVQLGDMIRGTNYTIE